MPRKKKSKIELTQESFLSLLNECYKDNFDLMNKLTKKYIVSEKLIDDAEDIKKMQFINSLGKTQNDTLKLCHDSIKSKMDIAKIILDKIEKLNNSEDDEDSNDVVFDVNDFENIERIKKALAKNNDKID